jgi:hypothetical protein
VHDPVPIDVAENPAKVILPSQISLALSSKVASPFDADTALLSLVWFPSQHTLMSMRAPATGAPLQSVTSTTVDPGEQSARNPIAPMPNSSESATVKSKRMRLPPAFLQGAVL